jgi:addiction module HigA family antidote
MSGSRTIIDKDDLLDNVHPGEILRDDFLIGGEVPISEVATSTSINVKQLEQLLNCKIPVTADLDLRLGRYFGMSEGFFLRLQNCFDLEEERRANGTELDQIARRAA